VIARHAPPTFTYVGRLVVEKNPSGSTPSAAAGSNRAAGAVPSGGASKLGGRYWKRADVTGAKHIGAASTGQPRRAGCRGRAPYSSDTGSLSITTRVFPALGSRWAA